MIKHVCIDFDGVINSYTTGWTNDDTHMPDPPVPGAIPFLRRLLNSADLQPCIYSGRSKTPEGIDAMRKYLKHHGMTWQEINGIRFPSQKPPAIVYIDDRGITFNGVFPTLDVIRSFQPWYKKCSL